MVKRSYNWAHSVPGILLLKPEVQEVFLMEQSFLLNNGNNLDNWIDVGCDGTAANATVKGKTHI